MIEGTNFTGSMMTGVADVIDAMKAIGKLEEKPEIAIRGGGHRYCVACFFSFLKSFQ